MSEIQVFNGSIQWCKPDKESQAKVNRAILRSSDIVFEIGDYLYDLKKAGEDFFEGSWTLYVDKQESKKDLAKGTFYKSSRGYFFFGEWRENGEWCNWWANLSIVSDVPIDD